MASSAPALQSQTSAKNALVVLGQTPPPYHGQAVAIQWMIEGLSERMDIVHIPMNFSETVAENGKLKFRKLIHLVSVVFSAWLALICNRRAVLYYPPAPGSWVPVLRDLVILSVLRPFAFKTVFHFHAHGLGKFLQERVWLRKLTWAWRRPDHAIVLGEACRADAKLIEPKSISVVPNGIAIKPATRSRKKADSASIRILYVGMLTESKGLFDLLDTAAQLVDLPVSFRLVGTYKYEDTAARFEQRRDELELGDMVALLGQRTGDQLWQEYADADIFFFPTKFESETFGVVTLEAMAHALPVVASRWRGPCDIVREGVTGFLCEPGDSRSFAERLRQLALSAELRAELGIRGKAVCESEYGLDSYLGGLERVFQRVR